MANQLRLVLGALILTIIAVCSLARWNDDTDRVVTAATTDPPTLASLLSVEGTPPTTTTTTVIPTTATTIPPPPPTTSPPPPARVPVVAVAAPTGSYADPADPATWDRLAQCESGGNWAINTGNGYYGGIQFSLTTWHSVGGTGYPHENSREEQIHRGQILQARSGWGQWPACTRRLGYR